MLIGKNVIIHNDKDSSPNAGIIESENSDGTVNVCVFSGGHFNLMSNVKEGKDEGQFELVDKKPKKEQPSVDDNKDTKKVEDGGQKPS